MYNLLIADDENIVRRGIKSLVDYTSLGISQVFEAENGETALELVKSQEIHIVFADINMPRMNGLEFAKQALSLDPSLRIALITGYDYFEYARTALKIGVDDYILKPISKDDVIGLIVRLVEKRKAADALTLKMTSAHKLTQLEEGVEENSLKQVLANSIAAHLDDAAFSLSLLAEEVGYNPDYLSTLFKKYFGANFRDYVLDLRLEKAKLLLLSTQMKNYEIAAAIGIEDANYLSACFKRRFGQTISTYRKTGGRI